MLPIDGINRYLTLFIDILFVLLLVMGLYLIEITNFFLTDSNEHIPTFQEVLYIIDKRVSFLLEYKLDRIHSKVYIVYLCFFSYIT